MPLPTRSISRAASTMPVVVASANSGLEAAPSPYPRSASGLRRPTQSLQAPENTLTIWAVASAAPSIKPMATMLAPRPVARKTGSRLWIISEETSISRLTQPSAQMLAGSRARAAAASGDGDAGTVVARSDAADLVHRFALAAQGVGHGPRLAGGDHHDHADAVVERAVHLVVVDRRHLLQPREQFAARPAALLQVGGQAVRQHARDVLQQAAAGDVGQRLDAGVPGQRGQHRLHVKARRFHDRLPHRLAIERCGKLAAGA